MRAVHTEDTVHSLARLALFADLPHPQLEALAQGYDEQVFAAGTRVLRGGISGSSFFVILDGTAVVRLAVDERRLGRGEFFGEISVLTGDVPSADVVAETELRCLVVPGEELEPLLLEHPRLMLRMLQAEALRVRDTQLWAS
jgi:monovalent cation:H+ antiporter, CPA1 family